MLYQDTSIDAQTVWLLMVLRHLHRTQEVTLILQIVYRLSRTDARLAFKVIVETQHRLAPP